MKDWDEECDGRCVSLAVRVEAGVFSGAWEPTPAEQGMFSSRPAANVVLTVFGGQPPVMLTLEPLKGGPHNDGAAGL
jgi:hypothetical protein